MRNRMNKRQKRKQVTLVQGMPSTQGTRNETDETKATEDQPRQVPAVSSCDSHAHSDNPHDYANKASDHESGASEKVNPLWTVFAPSVIGILTLFVIIIQAWIYARQLHLMTQSNRATAKAAKAAQDSASLAQKAMELDQSAWVSQDHVEGVPVVGIQFNPLVGLKNYGKTPTTRIHLCLYYIFVPDISVMKFPAKFDGGIDVAPISPTERIDAPVYTRDPAKVGPFSATDLDDLKANGQVLVIVGRVTYEDRFRVHHWFNVCRFLNSELKWRYGDYATTDTTGEPP